LEDLELEDFIVDVNVDLLLYEAIESLADLEHHVDGEEVLIEVPVDMEFLEVETHEAVAVGHGDELAVEDGDVATAGLLLGPSMKHTRSSSTRVNKP